MPEHPDALSWVDPLETFQIGWRDWSSEPTRPGEYSLLMIHRFSSKLDMSELVLFEMRLTKTFFLVFCWVLPNECHQTKLHFQNLSNRLIDLIENEDLANIPSPDRVEWITNWVYLFWNSVSVFAYSRVSFNISLRTQTNIFHLLKYTHTVRPIADQDQDFDCSPKIFWSGKFLFSIPHFHE